MISLIAPPTHTNPGIPLEMHREFWTALFMAEHESSPDGVLMVSPQQQWLYYNQRFMQLWGLSPTLIANSNRAPMAGHQAEAAQTQDPAGFMATIKAVYQDHTTAFHHEVVLRDGRVLEQHSYPIQVAGVYYGRTWRYQDITQRKHTETVLQARERLAEYAVGRSLDQVLQATLREAETLTGSSIGFYHFLAADQHTLLLQAWSENTLANMCTAEGISRHYDVAEAGVWVECVRTRQPTIHNDYNALANRKGLPPGHAPVIRELVVPVMRGPNIVAILGVGNKPTAYTPCDVNTVQQLADLAWEIVESKRTEEQLRQSEATLRALLDATPNGLALLRLDGTIEAANAVWGQWVHRPVSELLGHNIAELVPPALREQCAQQFAQVLQTGQPLQTHDAQNGQYIDSYIQPIRDAAGQIQRLAIAAVDVTTYHTMQQQLSASEARFRHLAEHAQDIIYRYRLHPTPGFEYVSPAVTHITGYTPEEHYADPQLGQKVVYPADKAKLQAVAEVETNLPLILRWVRKDGQLIWTEQQNVLVRDATGQVVAIEGVARDVTARQQVIEALRASEARYRLLVQNLPNAAVYLFDHHLRYHLVDGPVTARTGFTQQAMEGKTVADVLPPEAAARLTALYQRVLAGERVHYESVWQERTYESQLLPVLDEHGQVTFGMVLSQDVTERKQAEILLRQSEQRFRSIYEQSPIGISIVEAATGRFLQVNQQICNIVGRLEAELLTLDFQSITHPADLPDDLQQLEQLRRQAQPLIRKEKRYLHPDGGVIWGEVTVLPLDSQLLLAMVQDITQRKEAEATLAHRAQELAVLNDFLTATSQIHELPLLAKETLYQLTRLLNITGGWLQVLETRNQTCGLRLLYAEGLPPTLKAALAWQPLAAEADPLTPLQTYLVSQELTQHWAFHCYAERLTAKEKVWGVLGVCRPTHTPFTPAEAQIFATLGHELGIILENLQLVEQASQAEILKEVDGLRAELIANVSHELRTPLGLLMVMATTLLRKDATFEPAVQAELLQGIVEETDRLTHIVNNLLEASHLQSGRLRLDKQPINLGQLAEHTLDTLQPQLELHPVHFQPPTIPLTAWVDAKYIEQVLRNLLINAAKYSPPQAPITLSLVLNAPATEAVFSVQDEGIGITPEDQLRIFERFYRAKTEAVQKVPGLGLGLPISRGLVEAHGGRIWVTSGPACGSIFYVALPLYPKEPYA